MTIKAVIWDLGGVLVRTEDWGPREALAAELGLPRAALEERMFGGERGQKGQLGEITGEVHWQQLADVFGIEKDEFVSRFFAGDQLDMNLIEFIRSLKEKVKIGLLSNAFSTLRSSLEDDWQITEIFDGMIISAEVGLMKPDAAIYQAAAHKLGVQAEQSLFIDDFPINVAGAKAIGMHAIRFENREQCIAAVEDALKR